MKHYAFGGLPLVLPVTSCCILYVLNLNLGEFVGIHLIIQQHQVRLISLYSFVYQNVISVQTFNGASISNLLLVWHNSHKLWMNYVHIFWCSLVLPGAAKQLPKALSFFGLILTIHTPSISLPHTIYICQRGPSHRPQQLPTDHFPPPPHLPVVEEVLGFFHALDLS